MEEREGAMAGMRNSLIEMEGELRTKKHALSNSEGEARMLHDRLKDSLDKLQRVEGKIADAEAETNKVVSERDAHTQTIIFLKVPEPIRRRIHTRIWNAPAVQANGLARCGSRSLLARAHHPCKTGRDGGLRGRLSLAAS